MHAARRRGFPASGRPQFSAERWRGWGTSPSRGASTVTPTPAIAAEHNPAPTQTPTRPLRQRLGAATTVAEGVLHAEEGDTREEVLKQLAEQLQASRLENPEEMLQVAHTLQEILHRTDTEEFKKAKRKAGRMRRGEQFRVATYLQHDICEQTATTNPGCAWARRCLLAGSVGQHNITWRLRWPQATAHNSPLGKRR
jgi:hypothetical protein